MDGRNVFGGVSGSLVNAAVERGQVGLSIQCLRLGVNAMTARVFPRCFRVWIVRVWAVGRGIWALGFRLSSSLGYGNWILIFLGY